MTPLFRCPWCAIVERGARASALMRKHILKAHRAVLIRGLGLLESFGTRKGLDPPRNAAERPPRMYSKRETDTINRAVSGEGDTS